VKTVIFLGKRTSREDPLTRYPGAELWGTTHSNQRWAPKYGTIDSWHAWWDLHPFDPVPGYAGIKRNRPKTYRWYQGLPGPGKPGYRPLYLTELDPTIPAGVLFNKERILAAFDVHPKFYTCQVDVMLAHSILEGYEHIVLHGHGTKFEHKHMIDHCGVLVWMTIARERGIKVTILPPSWYIGPKQPYGISAGNWGFRP
jgi:hypothetical protein